MLPCSVEYALNVCLLYESCMRIRCLPLQAGCASNVERLHQEDKYLTHKGIAAIGMAMIIGHTLLFRLWVLLCL